jgi:nitroreductase
MTDFAELLTRRRAIRDFQDKDVPLDLVMEIIKESTLAPSSGNGQPWRFIIVRDRAWIKRISDESKRNLVSYLEKDPGSPLKKYETALRNEGYNVFYNAPCLAFIVGPQTLPTLQVDCALAAGYFMFSAVARGLGTCWVALGSHITDPDILKALGLSESLRIVAPIILGYPTLIPAVPPRNDPRVLKVMG